MENNKTISTLNELLHITNDRIKGFERVEGKVWESYSDLKGEYDKMISQAKIMKNEIINLITEKGGYSDENSSSLAGTIHRTWIDIKNSIPTSNNDKETLENVVFGEKHAIEAYDDALKSGYLCSESSKIIAEHLRLLRISYHQFNNIKHYKKKDD